MTNKPLDELWQNLQQIGNTKGLESPEFVDALARFNQVADRRPGRGIVPPTDQANGKKGRHGYGGPFPPDLPKETDL